LLAIGAHEIVMTELGELGPLDVQIYKADEVGEFSSGLTPFKAMHTILDEAYAFFEDKFLTLRFASDGQITTHLAADIAAQLTTGLFSPILRQVDPMRIGELGRHVQIALDYGNRIGHNNLKEGALNKLISGYPSHGFIIDREEAEELFKTVRLPSTDEMQLMDLVRGPFAELSAHAPYKFFYLDDMIEKCSLEQEEAENGDGVGENPEDTAAKG